MCILFRKETLKQHNETLELSITTAFWVRPSAQALLKSLAMLHWVFFNFPHIRSQNMRVKSLKTNFVPKCEL